MPSQTRSWSRGDGSRQFQDPRSSRTSGLVRKRESRWRPLDKTEDSHQSRKVPEALTPWRTRVVGDEPPVFIPRYPGAQLWEGRSLLRAPTCRKQDWIRTFEGSRAFLKQRGYGKEMWGGLGRDSEEDQRQSWFCGIRGVCCAGHVSRSVGGLWLR